MMLLLFKETGIFGHLKASFRLVVLILVSAFRRGLRCGFTCTSKYSIYPFVL